MKLLFVFVIFAVAIATFGTHLVFAEEDENFSFFLDKPWYDPRDVIEISGWVKTVYGPEIFIEIIDPDDNIIKQETSTLQDVLKIDHTIATLGNEWNTPGFYKIKLFYANETQSRLFAFGNFNPEEFVPQITLDKESYSWTDTVKISILSPNDNQNNYQIDKIKVDISSSAGALTSYILEETGLTHGVFSGQVILTGFSDFDVDGDGKEGDALGFTFGPGPEEGNLSVRPNDAIKISFSSPHFEETIETTAKIQFNIAKVQWVDKEIDPNDKVIVRVTDPDLNLHPVKKEKIQVMVSSYPQGYSRLFTLVETENNSGIFEGNISFITWPQEDGVLVRSGSDVFVKYEDRTLPSSYTITALDIIANGTVIDIADPYGITPTDEEIDIDRAEKLIELGNYYGLLSYSNEILLQHPNDFSAVFYKGVALWGIGTYNQALEYFDQILAIDSEHKQALYFKSKSLYQIKKYDEALIFIDKALSLYPNFQDAITQKELILAEKNTQANQPNTLSKVEQLTRQGTLLAQTGDYQGALRLVDQALELEPNNLNALNDKGWILLQAENPQEALVWVDKALEVDPNLVHALHNKGLALFQLERYEESKIWFDKAIENQDYSEIGDKVSILNDLGRKLTELNNLEEAIIWFDKALEEDPNAVYVLNNKGSALFELERYGESIIWFDKALEEDPGFDLSSNNKVMALNEIGRKLFDSGNFQEALIWYDKALEVNPDVEYVLNNKVNALNEVGRNFLDSKNPEESLVWFDKALEVNPNVVYVLNNKGWALYQLDNLEEALVWFDKALEEDPEYTTSLVNKVNALNDIGNTFLQSENPEESLIWFDKALEVNPDAVGVLNNKGLAYYMLGQDEKAISIYDQALQIDPDYELAKQNKELAENPEEDSFYDTIRPFYLIAIFAVVSYGMYYIKKRRQKHISKTRQIIHEPSFSVLKIRWSGSNITYQVIFDKERILFVRPDKIFADSSNISLDEILKMDKLNFEISYYDIIKIELKHSTIGVNAPRAGKMIVSYKNQKKSFDILEGESFDNCVDLVRRFLDSKLVVS